jgi:dCMP deaminase
MIAFFIITVKNRRRTTSRLLLHRHVDLTGILEYFDPLLLVSDGEYPMQRPSWDQYFMDITRLIATRSSCLRRQVGALLVKDRNILATGYNGVPSGISHCEAAGCLRERLKVPSGERHELCRGLHAEQNAIIQAAKHGTNINGATLYCTTMPCIICTKMIINAGVTKVIFGEGYADDLAREMITEAAIEVVHFTAAP